MSPEVSERSFEVAIQCALLQHGRDACTGLQGAPFQIAGVSSSDRARGITAPRLRRSGYFDARVFSSGLCPARSAQEVLRNFS